MAMNSLSSSVLRTPAIFIIIITLTLFHLLLLSPVSSLPLLKPPSHATHKSSLFEEKTRLGSTPPSCHNKCNQCHPCLAVQVPTLPSHDRFQPGMNHRAMPRPTELSDSSASSSLSSIKYSNYKPLGWKCRCRDDFFNP